MTDHKYQIDILYEDSTQQFNAGPKARQDVEQALEEIGYKKVNIIHPKKGSRFIIRVKFLFNTIKVIFSLLKDKKSKIIIQYPFSSTVITHLIISSLKKENITLVIHDINSLRFKGEVSQKELWFFNNVDKIIVHTNNMAKYLQKRGVKTKISVLELFDYYATEIPIIQYKATEYPYSVVYAGNLNKSTFLDKILDNTIVDTLYLYGRKDKSIINSHIKYEGLFEPNTINNIRGDWGLVWDGDSIDSCEGMLGNYIQYNAPHKASLYIAAGKPLIIWEKAGIAEFIINNKLGFTVKNLLEIPDKLNNISKERYNEYVDSIKEFQIKLLNGEMIKSII